MSLKSVQKIIQNIVFEKRKKVAKKKEKIMTTNQLKELFNKEAKKYYSAERRPFEVDDNNKKFLNAFCKYFAQDSTFETEHNGDLNKGLFVFGNNGTGKTSSFKIIQNISKLYALKQLWLPMISTQNVIEQFNLSESSKKDYIIMYYARGTYLFDDLGSEKEASNYGKEDIFIRILEHRYNQFVTKGTKTFITSNLSFDEIKKRYGERVYDRFYQMFNQIKLDGKSRRS
jgi:DNA replication protein DnaC